MATPTAAAATSISFCLILFWGDPGSESAPALPSLPFLQGRPSLSPLPQSPQWLWCVHGPGRQQSLQSGARRGPARRVSTGHTACPHGVGPLLVPLRAQGWEAEGISSRDSTAASPHPPHPSPQSLCHSLGTQPASSPRLSLQGRHSSESPLTQLRWRDGEKADGAERQGGVGGGGLVPARTTLPRKMVLPVARVQVRPTTLAPKFLISR